MVELRGLKIWIESEGKVLEEYGVERTTEDGKHSVSSYIISDVGKNFAVTCDNPSSDLMTLDFRMDGVHTESRFCNANGRCVARGVDISEDLYKPYQFGVLDVIDKPPELRGWDSIGTIEVKLYRVKFAGKPCVKGFYAPALRNDPVPEKNKKLAAHRITLGNPQKRKNTPNRIPVQCIDDLKHPFAVFRFRYRPKDLLQAQGIIPAERAYASREETEGTALKRKRSEGPESQVGRPSQIRRIEPEVSHSAAENTHIVSDDTVDMPSPIVKLEDSELVEEGLSEVAAAQLRMMRQRLAALEARTRRDRRVIQELRGLQQDPETIDLTEE